MANVKPEIENAVIDNILCYVSSSRHFHSDQTIISVCSAFFSAEKIAASKEVLCKHSKENIPRRRGENKVRSDLSDMISLFRKFDEDNMELPKFLCDSCSSMPPSSGFELIAEHIVGLVTEIGDLKSEISDLKAAGLGIANNSLESVKEDIKNIKQILNKNPEPSKSITRGKKVPFSFADAVLPKSTSETLFNSDSLKKLTSHFVEAQSSQSLSSSAPMSGTSVPVEKRVPVLPDNSNITPANFDSWQKVNRKKRTTVKGSKKVTGAFKSACETRDLYIGRCDSTVSIENVVSYIRDEFDINVLSCECISKRDINVKSFKVTVTVDECTRLMDPDLWPENIRVRKFYFKNNRNDRPT